MNTLTLVGWGFLLASWIIPYIMRKQSTTFESRKKSYSVGIILAAISLVLFVIKLVIY